jgi:exonuclease SbcC
MCYRENVPPLNLEGIRLACLAGANGHGKSTLLDAITWALWGKSRAAHDNDLISLGQSEMEVEFDFLLSGARYRVLRKRSSKGRGQSALELQVEHDGRYLPLSEPTVTATERRIVDLLRMDYETFINSAFLMQGRADEFTTKTSAERKRILGEILGLSVYDQYEQRARDLGRETELQERTVDARMQEIGRELEHEGQYEQERQQAEAIVARLGQELRTAEESANRWQQEKRALDLQRRQADDLRARVTRAERELKNLTQQLAAREERICGYEASIARSAEIEAGYAALQRARAQEADLSTRLSTQSKLKDTQNRLQQQVNETRVRLEEQRRVLSDRLVELRDKIVAGERVAPTLAEVGQKLARLAEREAEREQKRAQMQELSNEAASLQALNQRLKEDMAALQEKIALLRGAEAKCPLCGGPLSAEHQAQIIADMEQEGKQKGDLFRQNKTRAAAGKEIIAHLESECQGIERELRARAALQREEVALERTQEEAIAAGQAQPQAQKSLQETDAQLTSGRYAIEAQAELSQVAGRIAALGYDEVAHQAIRQQVQDLNGFEKERQSLEVAVRQLDDERSNCMQLRSNQARWQEDLARDQERLQELEGALGGAAEVERELRQALEQLEAMRGQESRARLALGAAQQKLAHCQHLRAERETQGKRLKQLAEEKSLYRDLQVSFGQKGLRAMIIESAIPEIEEEANHLLARMTENRMQVRFDTQRETLKGETVETLDIKIADELGTRDYEMYSGGEAFRVNFAVRIALSKLLARRAGAQLQTLIVDEGFGTQDTQGRERLIEAINSIRDDFACILVITHIEELQDAFPVRINVLKTAEGSRFEIV